MADAGLDGRIGRIQRLADDVAAEDARAAELGRRAATIEIAFDALERQRIKQRVFSESEITSFSAKMKSVTSDVASGVHMNSIILIGIDASGPFTILEGNHRMAGAMLVSPETAHQRFNFFCGLSPRMSQCCWYQTDFNTLSRYAKNIVRYMFRDRDYFIERTLRDATLSSGVVGSSTVSDSDLTV